MTALRIPTYHKLASTAHSQSNLEREHIPSRRAKIPKYPSRTIVAGFTLLMVGGVGIGVIAPSSVIAGQAEVPQSSTTAPVSFQEQEEEFEDGERSLPPVQSERMQGKEIAPNAPVEHNAFGEYDKPVSPPQPFETPGAQEREGVHPALTTEQQAQLTKLANALTAMPETELKDVCSPMVLGQAIVLSDWGRSSAARRYNNFFGLKDRKGNLRQYDSMEDSIRDFVRHITSSPYYKDARFFPGHAADSCSPSSRVFLLSGQDDMSVRRILVFNYLLDKGLTEDQAAGVIGNFVRESGINPAAEQKRGGSAKGLAQWQGGRYKALAAFAKQQGKPWSDLHVQLDFLWRELNGSERKAYNALKKTHNPREAARIFSNLFERPNSKPSSLRMDIRVNGAMEAGTVWALHEHRVAQVLQLVKAYGLADMMGRPDAQATIEVPSGGDIKRSNQPFKLVPDDYRDKQNDILPDNGKNASKMLVDMDNDGVSETPSNNISYTQHVEIVERELNEAAERISRLGYDQAVKGIKDVSKQVERDFRNFNGYRQGTPLGYPDKPSDIEVHPNHFTATQSAANDMNGYDAARSTQNAGRGVGFNYFINNKGEIYLVSNAYCHNMLAYNGLNYKDKSVSTEVAASVQSEVSGIQYEALAYLNAYNLIRTGKVEKGMPVSPIVKARIVGHSAGNDAKGMHSDMPEMVMAPVHELTIRVLEEQGYIR